EGPRTALVTGASAGIGAAIARALGALGWRVAVGGRREDRLAEVARDVEKAGGTAFAAPVEVSDPASLDAWFDASEAALGPLDVLVSNVAICVPGLLHELEPADIERELVTNLRAPMLLARRAIRSLRAREAPGDLVFVSSENAIRPRPFQAGYTATKMGVEGLAQVLRMELEGTGIRSTIVRPGPTGTEFARDWDEGVLQRLLRAWRYWGLQRHLRWMPPESVARAVVATVTAPPGTHFDVVQVMPEAPPENRVDGVE
ncbi:MAG: SDR family NAD(P)-dependent oxidoreductase, partial [Myxococcota bacterium]|nr:SDR family NAD(P)-dependent oxidoreductase [Myxococcota bacterium]